ncbi:MAG: 50S ribosomal protein L15 [Planctomycetota bacterium]
MNISAINLRARHHKRRKRVGRGEASGQGKTAGRGHKGFGQKSTKSLLRYEGGQTPLFRRIPKRGFNNAFFRVAHVPVNLATLESLFEPEATVDPAALKQKGVTKTRGPIKVLGRGEITKPLVVRAHAFSRSAREKIEKAGGRCEVVPTC